MKHLKIFGTLVFVLTAIIGHSQVVGGRTNSESSPKVSEATKLSGGGFTGDVNHMTGEYQGNVALGTVSTPAGLSYSLMLSYSSSFNFSTNQPMTAGIPFGDGWSPNIPTISIESEVFHRFSQSEECSENQPLPETSINSTASSFPRADEGDLFWFSPIVNIPGVGSGRAVFKYIDVDDSKCAVFVLNKFESPIELRYYGNSWTVKVADGTVYQLGTHLKNYVAPSNKRLEYYNHLDMSGTDQSEARTTVTTGDYSNPSAIKNAIEPKESYSVWYCDLIYNQNAPLQGIRFSYEKFGQFNFFKEFQQSRYAMVNPQVFEETTLPYSPDYSAYSDVFLKKVESYIMEGSYDIIELDYKILNEALSANCLNPSTSGVTAVDALYSSKVVYTNGGSTSFNDWIRYKHAAVNGGSVDNSSNPYIHSDGNYHRENVASSNSIGFNHGFLESESIQNEIYPGNTYELKTKIVRPSGSDLNNGNGTIDVAVVTKQNQNANEIQSNSVSSLDYNAARGNEIFSTFNMALKWQMGHNQSVLETSNMFVMPNVPSTFGGYHIQIGPGNSDIDYSYQGSHLVIGSEVNALNCYPQTFGQRDIKSGATIPSNFGTGHPWAMMVPIYLQMVQVASSLNYTPAALTDFFEAWWSEGLSYQNPNIPTKFDNTVELTEVQLIRYSKNPYMLQGVKQYRINGEYGGPIETGKKLVSQKRLEYAVKTLQQLKNYDYQDNEVVQLELNRSRNVILLESIVDVPVNGDIYALNYNLTNANEAPRVKLKYSTVVTPTNSSDYIFTQVHPYAGLTQYLLTEYVDQLGGITQVEYYPLGQGSSRVSNNYPIVLTCGLQQIRKPFGTNRAYTAHMAVKYLSKNDQNDYLKNGNAPQSSDLQRWEYVYDLNSIISNPQKLFINSPHFRGQFHHDYDVAFSKIRVYSPYLETGERTYIDYEYYGDLLTPGETILTNIPSVDNFLFYGKLKSQKTYSSSGVLHEELIINYGKTLAFKNGYLRPNFWKDHLGFDDQLTREYEYKDYYMDDVVSVDIGTTTYTGVAAYPYLDNINFNGLGNGVQEGAKFLELYFYPELVQTSPANIYMLNSYFIKKTSETKRTYENGLIKNSNDVSGTISVSSDKSANPFGTGKVNPIVYDSERDDYLISSIDEMGTDVIPTLIRQNGLSDAVLNALILNENINRNDVGTVLTLQNGLSNEVWGTLASIYGKFSPKNLTDLINVQPYFSDDVLTSVLGNTTSETDPVFFERLFTKNAYLSDNVVLSLCSHQEGLPRTSFEKIIEKQTQFTERVLESIINSGKLDKTNLVVLLKNQQLTDYLYSQIITADFGDDYLTALIEETLYYPSEYTLTNLISRTPTIDARLMGRILAKSTYELSKDLTDLLEDVYRDNLDVVMPPIFRGNPLDKYCANIVETDRTYIETVTEYEYYEADHTGTVVGSAYEILMGHKSSITDASAFPKTINLSNYNLGTGTRTIPALRLKHEPSWQVFSIKQSSPHLPGAYSREEYFYLFDLQNRYDRYWFNYDLNNGQLEIDQMNIGTGSTALIDTLINNLNWPSEYATGSLTKVPKFDGMERTRTYGNRVIAFQKSVFTKNTRDSKPLMASEYYQYDRRWNFDDLPAQATLVPFQGECIGTGSNTSSPNGGCTMESCTDCFLFKYTTQENMIANLPLNYCAWSTGALGNYVFCPKGSNEILNYYPNAEVVYCNQGAEVVEGIKALQPLSALANTLQLRSVIIQLDTIHNSLDDEFYQKRLDPKNKYVVDFYMGASSEEDANNFASPYEMLFPYDNLNVRTIESRNRYLQPRVEHNQMNVKTRYYYSESENNYYVNSNCTSWDPSNYYTTVNENIGLPTRISVSYVDGPLGDSMVTYYEYNEVGNVKKVIHPSGKHDDYTFDNFHRLIGVSQNGKELSSIEYHQWEQSNTSSFDQKTNQNYVTKYLYNSDDTQDLANTEIQKSFVNPLGMDVNGIVAYRDGTKLFEIHSASGIYDNWMRKNKTFKTYSEIKTIGVDPLLQWDENFTTPFAESMLENDPKGRAKRVSNYDVDVQSIHAVKNNYAIANNVFTSCELGLSSRELQEIMGFGGTSAYRFFRTEILDQDNKIMIEYKNAFGQKVASLSYSSNNSKIVTLYSYDSYGNLTKVINPNKQQSNYNYNMLGQLTIETTVDAGKKCYMYNKQGQISVVLDEAGRTNTVGSVSKPYFRVFKYDVFGRLIENGITTASESVPYPIYNKDFHPLIYTNTFAGLGVGIPSTVDGQPFYFNYVYSNISSQDWLCNYEGMDWNTAHNAKVIKKINGFDTRFYVDQPEKQTFYGSCANALSNGKIVSTLSYDNSGVLIQKTDFTYSVDENLASQTVKFHPTVNVNSNPSGMITSKIYYPSYNYRGSLLEEKADVDGDNTIDIHYFNEYDQLNRLVKVYAASAEVADKSMATLLVSFSYDDARGTITKKVHYVGDNTNFAQDANDINYSYDSRDRLTEISSENNSTSLMNYKLFYDANSPSYIDGINIETVTAQNNWNGNVNGSLMSYNLSNTPITSFNKPTLYGYNYDGLNRLTYADATVGDYIVSGAQSNNSYQIGDETITYDKIGNILTLRRAIKNNSIVINAPVAVFEQYTYNYQGGTNRLTSVTGLNGTASRSYGYDVLGNLKTDSYKQITNTTYGRQAYAFNLVKNGENISYLYSVTDQRIYKKVVAAAQTTQEYYLMDAFGKTIALKNMQTTVNPWEYYVTGNEREARLKPISGGSAKFNVSEIEYFITDHLGNTRVTYKPTAITTSGVQLQIQYVADYFPYGKVLREYVLNKPERYLTTQHERDQETGLDYRGARYYDSDVARFLSIDPLAKEFAAWSVYNYVTGNPIILIDPDGRSPQDWIKKVGSNKWEYHSGVQSQAGATARFGEGTEYKDDGETYDGSINGVSVGSVTLNTGGLKTWEGGSYQNEDLNPYPSWFSSNASFSILNNLSNNRQLPSKTNGISTYLEFKTAPYTAGLWTLETSSKSKISGNSNYMSNTFDAGSGVLSSTEVSVPLMGNFSFDPHGGFMYGNSVFQSGLSWDGQVVFNTSIPTGFDGSSYDINLKFNPKPIIDGCKGIIKNLGNASTYFAPLTSPGGFIIIF